MIQDDVRWKNQPRLKVLLVGVLRKASVVLLAVEQSSVVQVAELGSKPSKRANVIAGMYVDLDGC